MIGDSYVLDWYRFVLSCPAHVVKHYLDRSPDAGVLNPFCGTGTTFVECKKRGVPCVGIAAHLMTHFASTVKTDWSADTLELRAHSLRVADAPFGTITPEGVDDAPSPAGNGTSDYRTLPVESRKLLLADSISLRPLHKTLVVLDTIHSVNRRLVHWRKSGSQRRASTRTTFLMGSQSHVAHSRHCALVRQP